MYSLLKDAFLKEDILLGYSKSGPSRKGPYENDATTTTNHIVTKYVIVVILRRYG